jgi:hypothetical protein
MVSAEAKAGPGRLVGVISLSDIARESDASGILSRVAARESHV